MLKDVIEYEQNKRIATWLGYLSGRVQRTGSGWISDKAVRVTDSLKMVRPLNSGTDVEDGGGTAFIAANVVAKPIKGSAVFWMLAADDGSTNKKTVHAGSGIYGQ